MNQKNKLPIKQKLLMNPMMLTILLLLIQLIVLIAVIVWLHDYIELTSAIWVIFALALVVFIVNNNTDPAYKIAWLVQMSFVPIFGALLYLFIQIVPGTNKISKQLRANICKTSSMQNQNKEVLEQLSKINKGYANLAKFLHNTGLYPIYSNSDTEYYQLGDVTFLSMKEELKKAKHFIFMEYFIVAPGKMWDGLLEILEAKAKEGVEIRFMYDGTCMFSLPENYHKYISRKGIKCKIFAPVKPILSTYQNNRDHRKITVIDGQVAFTGGINLADEYINEKEVYGHWKDAAIKTTGDAVKSYTAMFLQMWNVLDNSNEDYAKYMGVEIEYKSIKQNNFVIPYADAPNNHEKIAEGVYMGIINEAKEYVHIMTPYLILDNEMLECLIFAAKKGVDIELILPHIPDKKIPFNIAHSYYPALIEVGVKVYEYTPGFVHAKVFVSDDAVSTVGTINMDYRSFYLHFENGTLVCNPDQAIIIEKDFQFTKSKSALFTLTDYKSLPIKDRIIGRTMRVFGPIM